MSNFGILSAPPQFELQKLCFIYPGVVLHCFHCCLIAAMMSLQYSAVNPWAFKERFQPWSGEKFLLLWEGREFVLHRARDRSLKTSTVPIRGIRELKYLEISEMLTLGGINCSHIPETIGSVGLPSGGHCANMVWSFLKLGDAQKKWMHFQFAEIFEVPALAFTVMQNEPETFRHFQ